MGEQQHPRHDAFISYSHAQSERHSVAAAVQNGLHRFARPWYRRRQVRVFRDETDLDATPRLFESICEALRDSRNLVLLASPGAARSEWACKELEYWFSLGRQDRLVIVLTEGNIEWSEQDSDFDWRTTTALPRLLEGRLASEPLHVDLRPFIRECSLTLKHPGFAAAICRISARLRNVPIEELQGLDRKHRRNALLTALATCAVLAMLAGSLALALVRNVRLAREERAAREQAIQRLASNSLMLAESALEDGEYAQAQEALHSVDAQYRGWSWSYFKARADRLQATLSIANENLSQLAISYEAGLAAVRAWGSIEVRSLADLELVSRIHLEDARATRFSSSGAVLLAWTDEELCRFDTATGTKLDSIAGKEGFFFVDAFFGDDDGTVISIASDADRSLFDMRGLLEDTLAGRQDEDWQSRLEIPPRDAVDESSVAITVWRGPGEVPSSLVLNGKPLTIESRPETGTLAVGLLSGVVEVISIEPLTAIASIAVPEREAVVQSVPMVLRGSWLPRWLHVAPNGRRVAVATVDGRCFYADATDGTTVSAFGTREGLEYELGGILSDCDFAESGGRCLLLRNEGPPLVIELDSGGILASLGPAPTLASSEHGALSGDGELAVVTYEDGTAATWDCGSGLLLEAFSLEPAESIEFVGSCRLLAIYRDHADLLDCRPTRSLLVPPGGLDPPPVHRELPFLVEHASSERVILRAMRSGIALYYVDPSTEQVHVLSPRAELPADAGEGTVTVSSIGGFFFDADQSLLAWDCPRRRSVVRTWPGEGLDLEFDSTDVDMTAEAIRATYYAAVATHQVAAGLSTGGSALLCVSYPSGMYAGLPAEERAELAPGDAPEQPFPSVELIEIPSRKTLFSSRTTLEPLPLPSFDRAGNRFVFRPSAEEVISCAVGTEVRPEFRAHGFGSKVTSYAYSPTGDLAVGCGRGLVRILGSEGEVRSELTVPGEQHVVDIQWAADGTRLLLVYMRDAPDATPEIAMTTGKVQMNARLNREEIEELGEKARGVLNAPCITIGGTSYHTTICPQYRTVLRKLVASGLLWDLKTGRRTELVEGFGGRGLAWVLEPGGSAIAVSTVDGVIRVMDCETGVVFDVASTSSVKGPSLAFGDDSSLLWSSVEPVGVVAVGMDRDRGLGGRVLILE